MPQVGIGGEYGVWREQNHDEYNPPRLHYMNVRNQRPGVRASETATPVKTVGVRKHRTDVTDRTQRTFRNLANRHIEDEGTTPGWVLCKAFRDWFKRHKYGLFGTMCLLCLTLHMTVAISHMILIFLPSRMADIKTVASWDLSSLPNPIDVTNETYHRKNTVLMLIQSRSRRQSKDSVVKYLNDASLEAQPTNRIDEHWMVAWASGNGASNTSPSSHRPATHLGTTEMATTTTAVNEEYCAGLRHFYQLHHSYAEECDRDWFRDQRYGFEPAATFGACLIELMMVSCLFLIFMPCSVLSYSRNSAIDMFKDLFCISLLPLTVGMSAFSAIFVKMTSKNGSRCFLCRINKACVDLDPFNYNQQWPEDALKWSYLCLATLALQVLLSIIAIIVVTQKYFASATQKSWQHRGKTFVVVVIISSFVFVPTLGVVRFQVLPEFVPTNEHLHVLFLSLFCIGMVVIGLTIFLPIFHRIFGKKIKKLEENYLNEDRNFLRRMKSCRVCFSSAFCTLGKKVKKFIGQFCPESK